jgi:hypothetical protein
VAEAVVDALEVIQVQQQQGATALVGLRRANACSARSVNSRRLGRPVSGSWWAR